MFGGLSPTGLHRQRETARGAVVKQRAVLQDTAADEHNQSLRGQWRSDGARRTDGDRQSDDFDLDRMDILLSRSVRRRSDDDHVNRRQIEPGRRRLVDAGRGRARIDQGKSSFRRGQRDPLGQKLLRDILFDAD